jgi:hypothetical protein
MTDEVRIVKVHETHTTLYALEPGETLPDALSVFNRTDHTRIPFQSVRTASNVIELDSLPFDSPLLHQDYSDMATYNFN